jgi:lipopolysaccharide export system permease protein
MRFSLTLSLYLGRQFLLGIGIVLSSVMMLVFIIDLVETLRKFGGRDTFEFSTLIAMTLMKMPGLMETIMPFAVLFGGMWTFTRLTKSSELVVARAAGVSVWQFLAPALFIGFMVGVFMVVAFNPLAAAMNERYERIENQRIEGHDSQLSISGAGLWLREGDHKAQAVVHALRVFDKGQRLESVLILSYVDQDRFVGRIDAASARLEKGYWQLTDAWVSRPNEPATHFAEFQFATDMTINDIEESFASPATLSVWQLPRFINDAETAGFSATRHRLQWHSILSVPLLLFAMILIAATSSLRFSRLGGISRLIVIGVLAGFSLYFLQNITEALGLSGSLPIALAAWAPTGIATLLGTAMLFHLEDG